MISGAAGTYSPSRLGEILWFATNRRSLAFAVEQEVVFCRSERASTQSLSRTSKKTTNAPSHGLACPHLNKFNSWISIWALRASSVIGVQLFVQFLNGVVALMLVRSLQKEEYGWFTIASSMTAVLSLLNDGGIASAVTSNGGTVWQDRKRLSALIHAALHIVRGNTLLIAAVVSPILVWLLYMRNAPWWVIIPVWILVVGPQSISARTTVLNIINRLHSRVRKLQEVEISGAMVRTTLTVIPALAGFINIHIAMAAIAVSLTVQFIHVRSQTRMLLDPTSDESYQKAFHGSIMRNMKLIMPNTVFHCLQSQLATGLLAVLGTSAKVADLGAISRLGFVSNLISAPLASLIAPAFARCQDKQRLVRLFLGVTGGYMLLFAGLVLVVHLFTPSILKIFGPSYSHLGTELQLYSISMAIGFLSQLFWALNFARGWVSWVWWNIPLTLFVQIASALMINVNSVHGAITFIIFSAIPTLLLGMVTATANFFGSPKLPAAA